MASLKARCSISERMVCMAEALSTIGTPEVFVGLHHNIAFDGDIQYSF